MKITFTQDQQAKLHKSNPTLYSHVFRARSGNDEIDTAQIKDEVYRQALEAWVKENIKPEHDPNTCACAECTSARNAVLAERATETARIETARLEAEQKAEDGILRIQDYLLGRVAGFRALLDTPNNRATFNAFINTEQMKGIPLGPELVDYAIQALQLQLEFGKPRTLPNGEPELPLDVDEATMKRASVVQLRDYWKRSNGQEILRKQTYAGSIRTSWFKPTSQVV